MESKQTVRIALYIELFFSTSFQSRGQFLFVSFQLITFGVSFEEKLKIDTQ